MKSRTRARTANDGIPAASQDHWERVNALIAAGVIQSATEVLPGAILVNGESIFSNSTIPAIPLWYVDTWFTCKDCAKREKWTARQQQWWYEVAGGEIETTAIRCKACRRRKRSEDAASTERTRQHRRSRAEKQAIALAEKLAAQGSDGFAVLDKPVTELPLRKRTWSALEERGFKTIGDLVAHDSGIVIRGLYQSDLKLIRTLLEKLGLTFIGAPVPRL